MADRATRVTGRQDQSNDVTPSACPFGRSAFRDPWDNSGLFRGTVS